jgi:hypothetical protein
MARSFGMIAASTAEELVARADAADAEAERLTGELTAAKAAIEALVLAGYAPPKAAKK